jgi:hypothetical protein
MEKIAKADAPTTDKITGAFLIISFLPLRRIKFLHPLTGDKL